MQRRFLEKELSMPPSPSQGNKTQNSIFNDANFDTKMVVVLAAILCALICVFGLNTIASCLTRLTRRFSRRDTTTAAARGLKKRDLRQIPVAVYGSGSGGEEIPATECPICLGEFEKGDKLRMLPNCNHGFHVRCIDTWLVSHSSCPNCRHSLLLGKRQQQQHGSTASASAVAAVEGSPGNGSGERSDVVVTVAQAS